jgi:hypothetical protein
MKTKTLKQHLAAALLIAALGSVASAVSVPVPDFSFENTTNITADGGTTAAPDVGTNWLAAGNGGVFLMNPTDTNFLGTSGSPGTLPAPADGTNYLVININGHPGYCWQKIGNLQSNTIYTLTIAVGQDLITAGGQGEIALVNGSNPFGTILAFTPVDSTAIPAGSFMDYTLVFTTGQKASGPLTILMQGNTGTQMLFDNVRLDATPAPASPTALAVAASPGTNVYVGTMVTLSEDPAGALPFTYQWQSDNGTGGANFSNISGATGSNYVIDTTTLSAGSTFEYVVVVSNGSGTSTSLPVILSILNGPPVVTVDTLPASGSDVVGSQVTFSASFDGTRPITYQWEVDTGGGPTPISGATNSTYTLSDLQLTDTAAYSLEASNSQGITESTEVPFIVNPFPAATNNIIIAYANQLGLGGDTEFTPGWTLATGSLIAGQLPSSVGAGDFSLDSSGTVSVLTDGRYGTLYPAGNGSLDFVTGGIVSSPAGKFVTYTLGSSPTGYDLTNIISYGGWSDAGRDQQRYTLYYSTVANPTNFTALFDVDFNPSNPTAVQSSTRATITSGNTAPLVKNVAAVKFDFTSLADGAENGYVGFCEFQVFGTPSAAAPVIASDTEPGSGSDVVGGTITFNAIFTGATSYQWQVDTGSGPVNISGATNTTLTLTNLQTTDTGKYSLVASNAAGTTSSTGSQFTVNPVPSPDGNNVVSSPANQTGRGTSYSPNWTIATGSLLAGLSPSAIGGTGNFINEGGGGVGVLTDGVFGHVGSGDNSTLATCGVNPGGNSVTYTLTGSSSGYDVTNIVTYGGWSDGGRDQQAYTISYATAAAPSTFTTLTAVSFLPTLPGSVPSTTRVNLTSGSGGPLAMNVVALKFDFTTPTGENGWEGYAELSVYGPASAPLPLPPTLTQDVLPKIGSDVVGSQVTFTAAFNGSAPITYQWFKNGNAISGANAATLTLSNLQLGDAGAYNLVASNSLGVATTTTNAFAVNPDPAPTNGVFILTANQTATGGGFVPTWTLGAGSLINGKAPSATGSGTFTQEGAAGVTALTDDALGTSGGSLSGFATLGTSGGTSVTYTLSGSSTGYNLSSIASYAGWGDSGRDQQAYTVSYSTASAPATFTTLAVVNFNPVIPASTPSADRVILTPATSAPLAANVAAVKFSFTFPAGENGYSGYDEFQIFGTAATPAGPKVGSIQLSGGNLIFTGTGGAAGSGYTLLTTTNAATPLANWQTNSTGVFDSSGNFSNSIPVLHSGTGQFFRLRIP